jgi:diguanylate cyclase (GGDEF)-like protein
MTATFEVLYIEVDLICILLLFYVLHHLENAENQETANVAFRYVTRSVTAMLLLDCFCEIFRQSHASWQPLVCNILLALCFCAEGLTSYFWMLFCSAKMGLERRRHYTRRRGYLIPLLILILLSLLTIWNGWIFHYEAQGVYRRGPLFFAVYLFPCIYILLAVRDILAGLQHKTDLRSQDDAAFLLLMSILPVAGSFLTVFIVDLPVLMPLSAMTILMVFMDNQAHEISTDSLTGLNNRRQFDKHLAQLAENLPAGVFICLLLLDVDKFKEINDRCGHYAGDCALMETAALLRQACSSENAFLARYGGDEFAILFRASNDEMEERLRNAIETAFLGHSLETSAPYSIRVSAGSGKYGAGYAKSIPELINTADAGLYEQKKQKQIVRHSSWLHG